MLYFIVLLLLHAFIVDCSFPVLIWVRIFCLNQDEEHYRKAWDVSGHRSARAQRSLGYLYLRDKKVNIGARNWCPFKHFEFCEFFFVIFQFEECIPCFQKSLEINSLQV